MKEDLSSARVLAFVDFSKPFILETDGSQGGLAAILKQRFISVHIFDLKKKRGAEQNCTGAQSFQKTHR